MIRPRVVVLAALLLVLAVPAAIAQGPAKNPAQNPECPRWREAFAGMPVPAASRSA